MWFNQNSIADESSPTAKLLSSTCEIGSILLSTLETHFSVATATDSQDTSLGSNLSVQEQCNMLRERLVNTVTSLKLSGAPTLKDEYTKNSLHGCISKVAVLSQLLRCLVPLSMLLIVFFALCFSFEVLWYYDCSSWLLFFSFFEVTVWKTSSIIEY